MDDISRLVGTILDDAAPKSARNEAFDLLVRRFQDMAYGFAFAMLRDRYLAEDAAQEAFAAAWAGLPTLRDPQAFPGWFRRVLFSCCTRITRSRTVPTVPLDEAHDRSSSDDPHAAQERRELGEALRDAIDLLPAHERIVATLFFISDHSYNDIAAFLELPLSTVKKRLHSARGRLKRRMMDMMQDELRRDRPSNDDAFQQRVARMLDAAARGDADAVRALLHDDGALADVRGEYDKTPLHLAGEMNHPEVVEALVAAGADISLLTSWGMTPLEWAATVASRDVAALLLDRGATMNLYVAAGLGMLEVVRSFWEREGISRTDGSQLICVDPLNGSYRRANGPDDERPVIDEAFYIACRNGHTEAAAYLLERGAAIDARGFFNAPALHWAAISGHLGTVVFLMEHGADPDLRDDRWDATAIEWAREGERREVVEYLARHAGGEGG